MSSSSSDDSYLDPILENDEREAYAMNILALLSEAEKAETAPLYRGRISGMENIWRVKWV